MGKVRAGIERLVRYCARPPFGLERLHALDPSPTLASPESRLIYRFPRPDTHGRTELLLTPLELLDALANFVPPPRVHRHRYQGVLAPNARLRPHVVDFGRPELLSEAPATEADVPSPSPTPSPTSTSTSPNPTTSISEAPVSGRPAGNSPPAPPRPSAHLGSRFRHLELSRLARRTLAPASAPVSSSPLLCLVTSCPVLHRFPPRKAL
jgi:hypothetical protein